MRELKIKTIYNHFKDKKYLVEGEARYLDPMKRNNPNFTKVLSWHSELDEYQEILLDGDGNYWHTNDDEIGTTFVIYKPLYRDIQGRKLFHRYKEMFLSEVDRVKYPKVTQQYRFEETTEDINKYIL